jgi:hypothetical protein
MLNALDDYPIHQTPEPLAVPATTDHDFYDRYWFNGYNDDGTHFFGFGMGLYPHRGILDCHFSSRVDGELQHCFFASRRAPQERTELEVGPCRLEVVEPLRTMRLIIDENPSGLACDLTFSTRTSALQEARQTLWRGTRRHMDNTRFDQFGSWSGTISTPDGDHDVSGYRATKDRSWGIRGVGERVQLGAPQMPGGIFFLWTPLFWDDHVTQAIFFDGPDGQPLCREAMRAPLFDGPADVPAELADVANHYAGAAHRVSYVPGTRLAAGAEIDLLDVDGSLRRVTLEPQMRFHFRGLGYLHPEWNHGMWKGDLALGGESFDPDELNLLALDTIHTQQMVKVSDGERTGVGAMEQLVIGPYAPHGFADWFDGAAG